MAEIKRRVYSPRGDRGGGGLIAQVTLDEEDVRVWLGTAERRSAVDRVSVQRRVSASLSLLLADVIAALVAREAAEGVADESSRRQPGEPAGEGSGASFEGGAASTPATSPALGPIQTNENPT